MTTTKPTFTPVDTNWFREQAKLIQQGYYKATVEATKARTALDKKAKEIEEHVLSLLKARKGENDTVFRGRVIPGFGSSTKAGISRDIDGESRATSVHFDVSMDYAQFSHEPERFTITVERSSDNYRRQSYPMKKNGTFSFDKIIDQMIERLDYLEKVDRQEKERANTHQQNALAFREEFAPLFPLTKSPFGNKPEWSFRGDSRSTESFHIGEETEIEVGREVDAQGNVTYPVKAKLTLSSPEAVIAFVNQLKELT
jgi:hypothetical protein